MTVPPSQRWEFEALDVRLVERWLAQRAATAMPQVVPAGPARQETVAYADTARRQLLRAHRALRTVRRGGRTVAELVTLGGAAADVVAEDLPSGRIAALDHVAGPVGRRVRLLAGRAPLAEIAACRVRDTSFALRAGDADAGSLVLEDAAVAVDEGRRRVRIQRVRVEGDPAHLAPLVAEMSLALGLRASPPGLIESVLAARGVAMPHAPSLGPTAIDAASTTGGVAYAVLRREFAKFLAKEPGTRLGDDPEELHDMRVASRRLRAAMRLFEAALPNRAAPLREELAWVAAALGEVRDLDVQAARLEAWAAADRRLATFASMDDVRSAAREEMLGVLDSARYRKFRTAFASMLRKGPPSTEAAAARAVDTAPDLIDGRRRKVRKAARRLAPESPPPMWHDLRIRCKRLRYAIEFFTDIYGDEARDVSRRLADVQEILGRHQDACIAAGRIDTAMEREADLTPASAFAMGIAAERCAQEAASMRRRFPAVYARTRGRPWRRLKRKMARMRTVADVPKPAPAGAPIANPPV